MKSLGTMVPGGQYSKLRQNDWRGVILHHAMVVIPFFGIVRNNVDTGPIVLFGHKAFNKLFNGALTVTVVCHGYVLALLATFGWGRLPHRRSEPTRT